MRSRSLLGALPLVVSLLVAPPAARADRVTHADVAVDAKPAGADVTYDLTLSADAARPSLTLYLAADMKVGSASVAGKSVQPSSEPMKDTRLVAWTLPAGLKAGDNAVRITATVAPGNAPGLRLGDGGGMLLPGSGWFPRVDPHADELTASTVSFTLPDGWKGIAAGTSADGKWTATTGRPYAVWGPYKNSSVTGTPKGGSAMTFSLWQRSEGGTPAPDAATVAKLLDALQIGLGDAAGTGDWKMVEVGAVSGGLRTLFWGGSPPENPSIRDRDLAGALAAGFWTDSVLFRGNRAAFLARAIPLQVGDATVSAVSGEEDNTALEAVTIGSRRTAFIKSIAKDRPLDGLVDVSDGAGYVLSTRGALVAHMLAESWQSRSRWMIDLRSFLDANRGKTADWDAFSGIIFWKTKELMEPFFTTTDLPDFRILSQGVEDTKLGGRRYAVEIENRGKVGASTELATFDSMGRLVHTTRVFLEAGGERTMKFADPEPVARIEADPRGTIPQADISGERVEVKPIAPRTAEDLAKRVPSFSFQQEPLARRAKGLNLELDEVSIKNFDGWVVPFSTHHGPSGACLLGTATLTIHPEGDGAAPFKAEMHVSELSYPDARDLWIRFPLSAWDQIKPQLGDPITNEDRQKVLNLQNWVYNFSFPTYFFEGTEAQVPPAGSSLVVFRKGEDDWDGYVRQPLPDATVLRRLWNHLATQTIWEDRR